MRFLAISCAIGHVWSAAVVSSGDFVFDSFVKGAQSLYSAGANPETASRLRDDPNIPFTPEDYKILAPQFKNPDALALLLVNRSVSFPLAGLSVSPDEAREGLLVIGEIFRDAAAAYIRETVHYRAKLPTPEAAVKRIHAAIDRLDRVDNLERVLFEKEAGALTAHPDLVRYVRIAILAMPAVFEHDVLGYVALYFREADAYSPDVARTLRKVFSDLQAAYRVFPADYYTKLKQATPILHVKNL